MTPTTLIIRTAGTNCDRELAHAFELAGSAVQTVHLNQIIKDPSWLERVDLIGFPGGFSYGDDIAAGRIFANRLRHHLLEPLRAAIARGVPMLGVCNGFQVLVKLGLLPEPDAGVQTATLADNACGRFIDRWVGLEAVVSSCCIWTRGLGKFDLPIAHGEGRFVPASPEHLQRWQAAGQIAVRYASGDNPNGSAADIAGVCDPSGLVLGLMPHPERFLHTTNHPQWTRQVVENGQPAAIPAGLRFFQNAVEHVKTCAATAVKV
jgi:phosphoribosylformylglycinamidine synthase subunit PurQ / glutaminase